MKKIIILLLFGLLVNATYSQDERYAKVKRDYPNPYEKNIRDSKYEELDKEYFVRIGTSKLNAALDNNGILTTDREIKLVGLLYRKDKLKVEELYIEIKRDGEVIYSSTESCGKNKQWKDFYIELKKLRYSENYEVIVYNASDKVFLENRVFYIRKEVK
ncbi:MAG: hypothetical protein HOO86_09505 [Bacteroidales bacterium]|nr:hypothetical protein [Bacteroidales bacterium]